MKVVYQHDERDCGAACLTMIAAHFGIKIPLFQLRELTHTSQFGCSISNLITAAEKLGISATALGGSIHDLEESLTSKEVEFPFIAHVIQEDGLPHFIVVNKITKKGYYVCDPGRGKAVLRPSEFGNIWTGHLVTFKKNGEAPCVVPKKAGLSKYVKTIFSHSRQMTAIAFLSLLLSALGILSAFSFQIVIDNFTEHQETAIVEPRADEFERDELVVSDEVDEAQSSTDTLTLLLEKTADLLNNSIGTSSAAIIISAVIVLYIIQAIIQFIRGKIIIRLSKEIDLNYFSGYYRKIIDLPLQALSTRQTGEYLSRLSDLGNIRSAIADAFISIIVDFAMAIACGLILFHMNFLMGIASIIFLCFYAILVFSFKKPIEQSVRSLKEHEAIVQSHIKEVIDCAETIKLTNTEDTTYDSGMQKFLRFLQASVKSGLINVFQGTVVNTLESVGVIVLMGIGCTLVFSKVMTAGMLVSFFAFFGYFTTPVKNLIALQPTIQSAYISADRLNDIIETEGEDRKKGENVSRPVTRIDFDDVCFQYDDFTPVFDRLSFHIHNRKSVAIIGDSGSGKTSIAKILLRLYPIQSGKICVNGVSVEDISLSSLHSSIAYVSQSAALTSGTIKENLVCGKNDITGQDIDRASELTGLSHLIHTLPLGVNTPLEENGANLSSGQRQLVCLTRAILQNPDVLILDEATSNMDKKTEAKILRYLHSDCFRGMLIVITHDMQIANQCESVFTLKNSKLSMDVNHSRSGDDAEMINERVLLSHPNS